MRFDAHIAGLDALARRLDAIGDLPGLDRALDATAGTLASGLRQAAAERGRGDLEVRIRRRGVRAREVAIQGAGVWALEFGSRARPQDGTLSAAVRTALRSVGRNLPLFLSDAVRRAGPGRHAGG